MDKVLHFLTFGKNAVLSEGVFQSWIFLELCQILPSEKLLSKYIPQNITHLYTIFQRNSISLLSIIKMILTSYFI